MVKSVTSLTRNGLRDWVIQRVTSVYLAIGFISLMVYLAMHPLIDYYAWQQIFSQTWVRIATFLFFVCLALHAWIGMWTVATDYLKCAYARATFYIVVLVVLLAAVVWSAAILWGQ